MTSDEMMQYLREQFGGLGAITEYAPTAETYASGPGMGLVYGPDTSYIAGNRRLEPNDRRQNPETGFWNDPSEFITMLRPDSDAQSAENGGGWMGRYDKEGNMVGDPYYQYPQYSWLFDHMDELRTAAQIAAMIASGLPIDPATLGELGINTALSASELATNQALANVLASSSGDLAIDAGMAGLEGLGEAALGELGLESTFEVDLTDAINNLEQYRPNPWDAELPPDIQPNYEPTIDDIIKDSLSKEFPAEPPSAEPWQGEFDTPPSAEPPGAPPDLESASALGGISDAALGELGINTGLSATDLAANQGLAEVLAGSTEAALGELGINTALTADQLAGYKALAEGLSSTAGAADVLAGGGNAIGGGAGGLGGGATLPAGAEKFLTEAAKKALTSGLGTLLGAGVGAAAANDKGVTPMGLQSLEGGRTRAPRVQTGVRGTGGQGTVDYFTRPYEDTNEEAVNRAYLDLFGRNAEPAGLEFFSKGLDTGQITQQNLLEDIRRGAQNTDIDRLKLIGDRGYAAGGSINEGLGYLRSSEDGMADRINAVIDNRQPAKLSGGEFVIPADVVSHLGNGNSDAGAKQLHEFMSRIRKARTGTPKQGRKINPNKFMPK